MIKLWLHTVTLSFLKCFILSACYRVCNFSLSADIFTLQCDFHRKPHKEQLPCLCTVLMTYFQGEVILV